MEDEWEPTRQRTARIPRQKEQHVQRPRAERGWSRSRVSGCVPDEPGRTGLAGGGELGNALSLTDSTFLFQPLVPFFPFSTTSLYSRRLFAKQASSSLHILHRQQPSAQQTHLSRPSPVKTPLTLDGCLSSEPGRTSMGNQFQGDLGAF